MMSAGCGRVNKDRDGWYVVFSMTQITLRGTDAVIESTIRSYCRVVLSIAGRQVPRGNQRDFKSRFCSRFPRPPDCFAHGPECRNLRTRTRSDNVKKDTPGRPIKPGQTLHVDVDLALVNVTVTDPYYRLVIGLEPDNFRIFEDNVEQEVVYLSSEDVPISIGVIFDTSGSMLNKLGKA